MYAESVADGSDSGSVKLLQVFLSYAREDHKAVRKLWKRLQRDGFDAWLDNARLVGGQAWAESINRQISLSDVFIPCVSPTFTIKEEGAGYVRQELDTAFAVAARKPPESDFIVPIRIAHADLPRRLAEYHCIDYFKRGGYESLTQALMVAAEAAGKSIVPVPLAHDTGPRLAVTRSTLDDILSVAKSNVSLNKPHRDVGRPGFELCLYFLLAAGLNRVTVTGFLDKLRRRPGLEPKKIHWFCNEHFIELSQICGLERASSVRAFLALLSGDKYRFNFQRLLAQDTDTLRAKLLGLPGVQQFTCDNIILYVANRPRLPINNVMRWVLYNHDHLNGTDFVSRPEIYAALQHRLQTGFQFETTDEAKSLDLITYRVGSKYCSEKPKCDQCPLFPLLNGRKPRSQRGGKSESKSCEAAAGYTRHSPRNVDELCYSPTERYFKRKSLNSMKRWEGFWIPMV